YVDDERFTRDFAVKDIETQGRRKKLVKYILCKLEGDASARLLDWESDQGTIEHVLPENPSADWDESFAPERQKDFVYRLGNLLLLEPSANREAQNAPFEDKRRLYEKSAYATARALAGVSLADWTPISLAERQLAMAQRAAHVWRSDFA
ncbi:MAG: HNH endonuclease, partial [Rhodocyclaceae bacterium]|nr:HNH endonuclease [Rhodocyclaceae bacterium]